MEKQETIIAYRNPLEAFLWESGIIWYTLFAGASFFLALLLTSFFEGEMRKRNKRFPRKWSDRLFFVSWAVFLVVFVSIYHLK